MAVILLKDFEMKKKSKDKIQKVEDWPASHKQVELLRSEMIGRFEAAEHRIGGLDAKIDRVEHSLCARMDQLESKLDNKMEQLESRLNGRMEQLESRLDNKMEQLESRLNGRMNQLESTLNGRMDQLEFKLVSKMDQLFHAVTTETADVKADIKRTLALYEEQNFRNRQTAEHLLRFEARLEKLEQRMGEK